MQRGLPIPGFRVSELLIIVLSVGILATGARNAMPRWGLVDGLTALYVATTVLFGVGNVMHRGEPLTVSALALIASPLQFFLLYRCGAVMLRDERLRLRVIRWILLGGLLIAIVAVLQEFDLLGVRAALASVTDNGAFSSFSYQELPRATGPFAHWHLLGAYLMIVILVSTSLLLDGVRGVLGRPALIGVLVAASIGLTLTLAIAPIVSTLLGIAAIAARTGRLRTVLLVLAGGVAVAMALFGRLILERYALQYGQTSGGSHGVLPQTISYRLHIWARDYVPALRGRLSGGYGAELPPDIVWTHTESQYVTFVLRGGIALLVAYLCLMWAMVRTALRARAAGASDQRSVGQALFLALLLLAVMNLIFPYFTSSGPAQLLWVLAAIAFAEVGDTKRNRAAEGSGCGRRPTDLQGLRPPLLPNGADAS
jgi:O-antigen ligase